VAGGYGRGNEEMEGGAEVGVSAGEGAGWAGVALASVPAGSGIAGRDACATASVPAGRSILGVVEPLMESAKGRILGKVLRLIAVGNVGGGAR
jgi:hypothetical protein